MASDRSESGEEIEKIEGPPLSLPSACVSLCFILFSSNSNRERDWGNANANANYRNLLIFSNKNVVHSESCYIYILVHMDQLPINIKLYMYVINFGHANRGKKHRVISKLCILIQLKIILDKIYHKQYKKNYMILLPNLSLSSLKSVYLFFLRSRWSQRGGLWVWSDGFQCCPKRENFTTCSRLWIDWSWSRRGL